MLRSLTTRGFRNLADATLQPVAGRQLLVGDNGAGKTSVLEAIYLAATSRSFRASDLVACLRHGEEAFHVACDGGEGGRSRLELGWRPGKRLRLVDGVELPLSEHVAVQPLVLWSAAESELLTGAPQLGRRLIDRGLVSINPRALAVLGRYRKLLDQKRRLLAQGRVAGLATWNELLAEAAVELIGLRADYVTRLAKALGAARERSALPLPELGLEYLPSPRAALEGREQVIAALGRVEGRERERGQPLVGPHRDGLRLLWGGRDAKLVASAGEGKAFGLLLAAAQGELVASTDRAPTFLLDDADAELDRTRLRAVWEVFPDGAQVLATSSRPHAWEGIARVATWRLRSGAITVA